LCKQLSLKIKKGILPERRNDEDRSLWTSSFGEVLPARRVEAGNKKD